MEITDDAVFSSHKDKKDAELRLILTRIMYQNVAATEHFLVPLHVLQRTFKLGAVLTWPRFDHFATEIIEQFFFQNLLCEGTRS